MAANPIVNIKILADASQAAKTMDTASGKVSKFGGAMKSAALPIAAAGAALYGMGKSAVEDAAGQAMLAKSLKNTVGATQAQSAAVEEWITKTSMASGVADDELRPAMSTLARATGSVSEAQKAMGLAMDIAATTGKPLSAVTDAMAKGYAGNTGALGKLVPGLDKSIVATKDMAKVSAELARVTGGAAAENANTAAGQFQRMTLAMDETQESIGGALLPVLTAVAPVLQTVAAFLQRNADVVGPLVIVLGILAAVVWAVNAAMAANPFVLVAIAIAALVAGVIIAYKKCETFRNIVQAAFRGIAAVAQWLWNNVLKPVFRYVVSGIQLLWKGFLTAATVVAAAARGIATAAQWLWTNALKPVINFIVGAFQFWWTNVLTVKDKILAAFRSIYEKAVDVKDKVVGAITMLAEKITAPFDAVIGAIQGVITWFGNLFDKITSFKLPGWVTSIAGSIGSIIGLSAAPAPQVGVPRAATTPAGRAAVGSTAAAASGTAATLAGLIGSGMQIVVQVSDRRMADLIDVQIRSNTTATARSLTRRQVVIV